MKCLWMLESLFSGEGSMTRRKLFVSTVEEGQVRISANARLRPPLDVSKGNLKHFDMPMMCFDRSSSGGVMGPSDAWF